MLSYGGSHRLGFALAALTWTSLCRATDHSPAPNGTAVDVTIAGTDTEAQSLVPVLDELVHRTGSTVQSRRVDVLDAREIVRTRASEDASVVARVWIVIAPGSAVTVYLADGRVERILLRQIPLESALDEVTREEIGHIVLDSVLAIRAGEALGRPRDEVSAQLGLGTAHVETSVQIDVGAFYQAALFSNAVAISHGPGITVGLLRTRGRFRPGVALRADYRLPIVVDGTALGVRLDTIALRALGSIDFQSGSFASVRTSIGVGVDLVSITPRVLDPSLASAGPPRWNAVPVLRAEIGVHVWPTHALEASLAMGCDVEPSAPNYYVRDGSQSVTLLTARPIQPFVILGFAWSSAH